jgi:hypothetical protein
MDQGLNLGGCSRDVAARQMATGGGAGSEGGVCLGSVVVSQAAGRAVATGADLTGECRTVTPAKPPTVGVTRFTTV